MHMEDFQNLGIASFIYFFSGNMTSMFLPVYYITLGLSISQMAVLLLVTFIIIGLLPITLHRFVRNFERVICFGVLFTMVFHVLLIFVKNPVVLGVTYGLGIATFWPSFNLLQFSKSVLYSNSINSQYRRSSSWRPNYRKFWFSNSSGLMCGSLFCCFNLFYANEV